MNQITEVFTKESLNIIDLFLRMSENMVNMPDEKSFMEVALADVGKAFKASRVYVFDYREPRWYNTFEWLNTGVPSVRHLFQGIIFEDMEQLESTLATFNAGKLKTIEHIDASSAREKDFFSAQGIVSMIAIPLFSSGKFIGFFGLDQCEDVENWVSDHVDAAETMGHLLNNAKAHFKAQAVLASEDKVAKKMLDAFPVPFYVVNPNNYEMILCNKAFEDFVGEERLSLGQCYKILHNLDAPCSFCGIIQMQEDEKTKIWQHHNEIFDLDFTIIANKVSWMDVEDAHAVAFVDITDSLLLQKEQVLELEAMKMKGRFLANMSHELRTPVNGIMGITRLAEKNTTDAQVQHYLQKIQYSAQTLLTVINNILDFLKLEAGKMGIEQCPFVVKDIFEKLHQEFLPCAKAKDLELEFVYVNELPAVLKGDPLRFSQVVHNILSNAIKFTEHGKVQLQVQSIFAAQENMYTLHVAVQDTGVGMSESHIKQLFNVFFLVDASFARREGGAGVGLPLAQGLLELMGGDIQVRSTLGQGTVVTCSVPFAAGHTEADKESLVRTAHCPQDISVAGLHVLLAEDNEINALIASELLESFQCTVDVASDGVHVLDYMENKRYDVILMDLEMPRMNGFEATMKIRQDARFHAVPIIGMSAHSVQDMKNNEQLTGMQDYITKPFEPQRVLELLHMYTRGDKKDFTLG